MAKPTEDKIELKQKRLWFWLTEYQLNSEGLRMVIKTPFQHTIKKLNFEDIGRNIVISEWINLRFFALSFLSLCIIFYLTFIFLDWNVGVYLSLTFGLLSSLLSYLYKNYPFTTITLAGGFEPVTLYLNTPDTETFNHFIHHFLKRHKKHMVDQYIPLTSMLSYEYQYQNIIKLKEKQFITDEECKAYKNKLDSIFEFEEIELFPFSLN